MTMPNERYRAVELARNLLEDLTTPSLTPKIPSYVRDRAKSVLRHFPNDFEMDEVAKTSPDYFSKEVRLPCVPPKKSWWWR